MNEDTSTRFDSLESLIPLLQDLLETSQRKLDILSHQLDARVFARPELIAAIATLAQASRHTQVRILLHQPLAPGHPLLELQQRLSSKIRLQIIEPPNQHAGHSFVCGDDQALVFFNNEAQFEGFYRPQARAHAKRLGADFDLYWQRYSAESHELRRLYI